MPLNVINRDLTVAIHNKNGKGLLQNGRRGDATGDRTGRNPQ